MNSLKTRDFSIDIIKFLAVLLIINSHADICYVKYSVIATGGAIGDALFLFCSGYTLFWKKYDRFDSYYKRRISRIYPSVLACIIFSCALGLNSLAQLNLESILGGSFVIAIMVYYVLLYLTQKYALNRIIIIAISLSAVTLLAYYFFPYKYETGIKGIYGISTPFRWIPYFGFMLMGAWTGRNREKLNKVSSLKMSFTILLLCIVCFYGIQLIAKKNLTFAPWQIISLPFLFLIVFYFWRCCSTSFAKKIYDMPKLNGVIMVIGGLCLESYLIQLYIITDKFNFLFPLNILLIFVLVLLAAYGCRCIARFLLQTFKTEDYNWKAIFSLR